MAIQNRHGTYPYFDKGKMVVGEIAVVTGGDPNTADGKSVYMCFGSGDCQRFTTAEELADAINRAIEQSGEFQDIVETTVTEVLEDHPEWSTTVQDGAITPAKISSNFITSLTENSTGDDTDLLVVGNHGTSTLRKFTFANLATFIKGKIASLIRDGTIGSVTVDLNTITDGWHQIDATAQPSNMPINAKSGIVFQVSNTAGNGSKYQLYVYRDGMQLWQRTCWYGSWSSWQKIYGRSYASVTGAYGFSSVDFWRHGNEVTVHFTGTPSGMTVGWKTIAQIPDEFVPLSNTPYATFVPQDTGFQPFVVRATSSGTLDVNPTYVQLTGMVNAVYKYYVD